MELTKEKLDSLRTTTSAFMNHVYWVKQSLNVLPDKEHFASCINFVDLQEYREEFCDELINTIPEWIYSQDKARTIIDGMMAVDGRGLLNAHSALRTLTFKKFRNRTSDPIFIQGQFGELVLFNLLQHFFDAVPLIRKMPLTTTSGMERFGADAIHYNYDEPTHLIYLGEAKSYTSSYRFNAAFEAAINSIITTYQSFRSEINLYIYDDFLDESLIPIAQAYKKGTLKPVELHLVSVVIYNETKAYSGMNELEIKASILAIINERTSTFDKKLFDSIDQNLLPRFNYIIFPVWRLNELISSFQTLIGK